jgi:hypothetical protein
MTKDKSSSHNSIYLFLSLNRPLKFFFMTQHKMILPHNDIVCELNYEKLNLLTRQIIMIIKFMLHLLLSLLIHLRIVFPWNIRILILILPKLLSTPITVPKFTWIISLVDCPSLITHLYLRFIGCPNLSSWSKGVLS